MDGLQMGVLVLVFVYGAIIGSFLNVCIYRIPANESIIKGRSHCMSCRYQLAWRDLIPLFSWLAFRGRCRKCGGKISVQYPLVEALNGAAYVVIFSIIGFDGTQPLILSVLYSLMASALLALSIIDWRTYEIPLGFNIWIGILGVIHLVVDSEHWHDYVIGFFAVSACIQVIVWVSKGRAIGGGDAKLMAAAGLLLGWKLIILAFAVGCILGSVIHITRMKVSGADHMLAMGPYLAMGIIIAALWGDALIQAYLNIVFG